MRILLDTQALLWSATSRRRFGPTVLSVLEDTANDLVVSAATAWEIAIKYAIGKLSLPSPPDEYIPDRMRMGGLDGLPVEHAHALRVAQLPLHHRDPFDRLLIAQAQIEGLTILSSDRRFSLYDVEVMWTN